MNCKIQILTVVTFVLAIASPALGQEQASFVPQPTTGETTALSAAPEQAPEVNPATVDPMALAPVAKNPAEANVVPKQVQGSPYPNNSLPLYNSPKFNLQFGLGITGIVASGVLYPFAYESWSYYFGGIQLDFLWRVHSRLTLQFSPGILISDTRDEWNQLLVEVPFSLGLRIHLRALPKEDSGVFVMPYAALGFQMNFLFGAGPTYDSQSLYDYYTIPPSLYLGANLGAGVELRLHKHFAIHGEVRGFAQGPVNIRGYDVYLPPRIGLYLGTGLAAYF